MHVHVGAAFFGIHVHLNGEECTPPKINVWNLSTEIENETPNTEFNKDRDLRWF